MSALARRRGIPLSGKMIVPTHFVCASVDTTNKKVGFVLLHLLVPTAGVDGRLNHTRTVTTPYRFHWLRSIRPEDLHIGKFPGYNAVHTHTLYYINICTIYTDYICFRHTYILHGGVCAWKIFLKSILSR